MAGNVPWYAEGINQDFFWTPQNTHAHSGVDLNTFDSSSTGVDVPITAPFDATQVSQGQEPWGGQENIKVVDKSGQPHILSWLHMSSEIPIGPGSPIHAGDLLGYSGTPPAGFGNGPHIHYEETYGITPPYMGYSPWTPTARSFPVDPKPMLAQLKTGGEGGTMGGASGGIFPPPGAGGTGQLSTLGTGGDPFGDIGAGFALLAGTIDTDIYQTQKAIADGLKRAGVFVVGIVLAFIGGYILFHPEIQNVEQGAKKLVHTPGDLIKSLTGGGSSPAPSSGKAKAKAGAGAAASKAAPEAEAAEAGGAAEAVPAAAVAAA